MPRLFLADGYTVRTGNLARRTLRDGLVDLRRTAVLETELPAGLDARAGRRRRPRPCRRPALPRALRRGDHDGRWPPAAGVHGSSTIPVGSPTSTDARRTSCAPTSPFAPSACRPARIRSASATGPRRSRGGRRSRWSAWPARWRCSGAERARAVRDEDDGLEGPLGLWLRERAQADRRRVEVDQRRQPVQLHAVIALQALDQLERHHHEHALRLAQELDAPRLRRPGRSASRRCRRPGCGRTRGRCRTARRRGRAKLAAPSAGPARGRRPSRT